MSIGRILTLISIIIVVGPLAFAVILYRDNLTALIMPNIEDISEKLEEYIPTVKYLSHEEINETFFLVRLNVTNNSDESFTFNEMNFSAYCKEHDLFLGYGYGEDLPITIKRESSAIFRILITFTPDGRTDIEGHRGETDFYAILRDVNIVVQGITVELGEEIEIGPLEIPT